MTYIISVCILKLIIIVNRSSSMAKNVITVILKNVTLFIITHHVIIDRITVRAFPFPPCPDLHEPCPVRTAAAAGRGGGGGGGGICSIPRPLRTRTRAVLQCGPGAPAGLDRDCCPCTPPGSAAPERSIPIQWPRPPRLTPARRGGGRLGGPLPPGL